MHTEFALWYSGPVKTVKKKAVAAPSRSRRRPAPKPSRRRPPAADLREFYGILSKQEADQVIRDIDQAFEQIDAE